MMVDAIVRVIVIDGVNVNGVVNVVVVVTMPPMWQEGVSARHPLAPPKAPPPALETH